MPACVSRSGPPFLDNLVGTPHGQRTRGHIFGNAGAVLVCLAIVVVGFFFDIKWCLVGGIEQIVHGAQAHPTNTGEIVWGVVRTVLTGLVTWVDVVLAVIVGKLGFTFADNL